MKLKLDKNLPAELAADLRNLGQDTDSVVEEGLRGASDPSVLGAAAVESRVLFRPDTSGRGAVIAFVRERLDRVLRLDLTGRLTVVGPSRIRFR